MLRQIDHSLAPTGAEPPLLGEPPIEQLRRALAIPAGLISGIRNEHWNRPTPCTHWSVRDLVGHLIEGHHVTAALLDGTSPIPRPATARHSANPAEALALAYRDGCEDLLAALTRADRADRLTAVPLGAAIHSRSMHTPRNDGVVIGPVSETVVLHMRIVECLTHGWDLAHATGQPAAFPEDLAEQALGFIIGRLIMHPEARAVFGPSQVAGAYTPSIDRLAACLGRTPTTSSQHPPRVGASPGPPRHPGTQ
jgi:uncharacterized protein (TIGR03086 family)